MKQLYDLSLSLATIHKVLTREKVELLQLIINGASDEYKSRNGINGINGIRKPYLVSECSASRITHQASRITSSTVGNLASWNSLLTWEAKAR